MPEYKPLPVRRRATLSVAELANVLGLELLRPLPADDDPNAAAQAELTMLMLRSRPIDHASHLDDADATTIVFAEDADAAKRAFQSQAGAILLPAALALDPAPRIVGQLLTEHPRLAFARAAQLLRSPEASPGSHPTAAIAYSAQMGLKVTVGAFAVVEDAATVGANSVIGAGVFVGAGVEIGTDCRIYPRVVIYPGTRLGDRVVVHSGAVLGSDGFGYVRDPATGAYLQFPQQGTLVIEDDVEIGANTTIDRGALKATRIGRGVKLDNLVHVGHNASIGPDTVIAAQTGISGSSTVGAGAVIAGQVGIGDHAGVGAGVILGGQAGVLPHKQLEGAGQVFWGTPAKPVQTSLREMATLTRLARRRRSEKPAEGGGGA